MKHDEIKIAKTEVVAHLRRRIADKVASGAWDEAGELLGWAKVADEGDARAIEAGRKFMQEFTEAPSVSLGNVERLTLALMRLTAWREDAPDLKPGWQPRVRSWKGYAFYALKGLADHGMADDNPDRKTVVLSPAGVEAAEAFLRTIGMAPRDLQTRSLPPRPEKLEEVTQ